MELWIPHYGVNNITDNFKCLKEIEISFFFVFELICSSFQIQFKLEKENTFFFPFILGRSQNRHIIVPNTIFWPVRVRMLANDLLKQYSCIRLILLCTNHFLCCFREGEGLTVGRRE